MRVVYAKKAVQDANDIIAYILEDSKQSAEAFTDALDATLDTLSSFSEIGRNITYAGANTRILPIVNFKNYVLFYEIKEDHILVVRISYGGRDLPKLFEV